MDTDAVSVTFDNLVSEHVAADRLYYRSTRLAKVDKFVAAVLLLVGVIGLALVGVRWWTLVWFALAPLEYFNLLSIRPLMLRLWFKRNPKYAETYQLEFSDSGVHFQTDSIDSRLAWDHYTRLIENDALCLLVYGSHMYTVVPKRAFGGQAQLDRFRELAGRHLSACA